jgi:integrase
MDARLRFAIGTGARQGGMMSLRVPQINFKTWKVTLLGEDQKDGTDLVVPIPDDVVLRAYLNTRRFLQAPDNFVFGTPDGKFIEKFTIAHLARDR